MEKQRLITPTEAAEILGVRVQTLAAWRASKRYPLPYTKLGRAVRYRRKDIDAFIESGVQGGQTAE